MQRFLPGRQLSVVWIWVKELSEEEDRMHERSARAAEERELVAWGKFKVFKPAKEDAPSKAAAGTRRALT